MTRRPYTVVLMSTDNLSVSIVNSAAPLDRAKARWEIEKNNPGCKLVALIPGHHAAASLGFHVDDAS
jgi:hypothetical protein